MSRSESNRGAGNERRRWRVPPPVVRSTRGLQGMDVLEEHLPELGGFLWRVLRGVTLWASVRPPERKGLFDAGAEPDRRAELASLELEPQLREALEPLVELLGAPEQADAETLERSCTAIAQWAEAHGARGTRMEFTLAATQASPAAPQPALSAARAARDMGDHALAEAWYQRSIALARQAGNWEAYARAYTEMGEMCLVRGAYGPARRALLKAFRSSGRRGLRRLKARALHDLFLAESGGGRYGEANRMARAAMRAYPPGHAQRAVLACDIARSWIAGGHPAEAVQVLNAALPLLPASVALAAQGSLARAAGALGDETGFRRASTKVVRAADGDPGKAAALLDVAEGARALGQVERAAELAERGLKLAHRQDATRLAAEFERVLGGAAKGGGRRAAAKAKPGGRKAATEPLGDLVTDIVEALAPRA